MRLTKIEKLSDTPITPADIDTSRHFWSAFDNCEREISANWLVSLAQQNNHWKPFTREEIESYYNSKGIHRFLFNGVDGYLIRDGETFYYTVEFVAKCYGSSPVKTKE